MASLSFPTQTTSATLASGDNTIVASAAGAAIKVYAVIIAAGANADQVTLKFTNGGTASTAFVNLPLNTTVVLPMTGTQYALCDPGTAFVVNSATTTTKVTVYFTKGA